MRGSIPTITGRRKTIAAVVACTIFCLAFLALLSSLLIRDKALDTSFYMSALDESRAFERVYSDLLADPELTRSIDPLFGRLGIDRPIAVSTLRYVAPPDQLREWTETALENPVSYLRGDATYYSGNVDLVELLNKQRSALSTYITQLLVASPSNEADSIEQFERDIEDFSRQLVNGRIPRDVPQAELSPEATERITNAILRPLNPQAAAALRPQVSAYISLNDIIGALSIVAPVALQSQIENANEEALVWIGGNSTVDPIEGFADILTKNGATVDARLTDLRSTVDTYSPPWLRWASVATMAMSFAVLLWIFADRKTLFLAPGALLTVTGLTVWLISATVGPSLLETIAGDPLAPAQADRPEGWGLPASARDLVGDINDAMFEDLADTAGTAGLFLAAPGGIFLVVHFAISFLPPAIRGQYDWLVSRELAPTLSVMAAVGVLLPLLVAVYPQQSRAVVCNGSRELCDRPYNEVVFPATHNSMSTSSQGWLLPSNDVGIREQLDDGVRAFLIDTHYWRSWSETLERLYRSGDFSPGITELLNNIFGNVGEPPDGTYLCHTSCWFGATPLESAFADIKDFMDSHPNEVVTLIIQDGISVDDTTEAFSASGLTEYVYTMEEDQEKWPTLGEMIDSGERLVVMAEFSGPPPDWYAYAWDYMQETPYDVANDDELDCSPNRGDEDNPLFLMNNWVNRAAPDRVDASSVNSYSALVGRARECELQREQLPNFIAVNFHRLGGLFEAVNALNGVEP